MKKENLDRLVQETIDSLDGAAKASPAPFLLTRIRAKMANSQQRSSAWERAGLLLTRPAVAFGVLATVILMNVYIVTSTVSNDNNGFTTQTMPAVSDDYSINAESSLYDFENVQP